MSAPVDAEDLAIAGFRPLQRVAQSHLGDLWVALDERGGAPGVPVLLRHVPFPNSAAGEALQHLACAGRAAMALRHENVASVLDVVQEGTSLAIAYEYVEAQPLGSLQSCARARERRFPVGVSLRVLIDLLRGVQALQDTWPGWPSASPFGGLSPASVLVSLDGRTRLCDPLIASSVTLLRGVDPSTAELAYLAPERVHAAAPPGPAADVFTAATILWELLAGRRLLSGRKQTVQRKLLEHDLPPLRPYLRRDQDISNALLEVVERSLSAAANERPATPGALAIALERCGHEIASLAQVSQFVRELSGQRFERLGAELRSTAASEPESAPSSTPQSVPAPVGSGGRRELAAWTLASSEAAIAVSRATSLGLGMPAGTAAARWARPGLAGASALAEGEPVSSTVTRAAPASGLRILPSVEPVIPAASIPALPLVRRRSSAPLARAGSLPPFSLQRRLPVQAMHGAPAPRSGRGSVARKRALLAGMAAVVLGIQFWLVQVARSHPHDFWSALKRTAADSSSASRSARPMAEAAPRPMEAARLSRRWATDRALAPLPPAP